MVRAVALALRRSRTPGRRLHRLLRSRASHCSHPCKFSLLSIAVVFGLPAWVEVCRQRRQLTVPDELSSSSYFEALTTLGRLVCAASSKDWDFDLLRSALSALAISKGSALLAEALLELTKLLLKNFLAPTR